MKNILYGILGLGVFIAIILLSSEFDIFMSKRYGKKKADVKREIFENSNSRIEGATQDLAKYKLELQKAKSQDEKLAIEAFIRNSYSNLDAEKIDNYDLKKFLIQCRGSN